MSFCHLHNHDTYSLLDGYGTPEAFAKQCAEIGMIALAQTNHGTIAGHIAHAKACKENGIHPVFGCEFYLAQDMKRRGLTTEEEKDLTLKSSNKAELEKLKKEKMRDVARRNHILILAMNDEGYVNLRTLVSLSHLEGFYRKPRIDYQTILKHQKGLFVSTACQQGDIPLKILNGEDRAAEAYAVALNAKLGGRFALEIMPLNTDEQRKINLGIQRIAKKHGIRVIATNDSHYVLENDSWAQEVLLAIGTNKTFDDPTRMRFGNGELFLRSEDQMFWAFKKFHPELEEDFIKKAMDTSYDIAFQCNVNPLKSIAGLPLYEVPKANGDSTEYLRHLCAEGWKNRGMGSLIGDLKKVYGDRVRRELDLLRDKNFENYFLIVWDIVRWAKENDIAVGPARGSSAGSLVAFLLGITDIDPIRFNLSFERFIAPHRSDYPDIDIDFEDIRRPEILQYLVDTYGEDRVAKIATMNVLKFRSAFRDAARIFRVPQHETNRIIGTFDAGQEEDDYGVDEDIIRTFKAQYPNVIKATDALVGQLRSGGTHAAGIVIADRPLLEVTAMELRGGTPLVALTKDEAESLGLVKIDILGLKTMSVISWAIKTINVRRKDDGLEPITLESITTSLNDDNVFAEFAAGNTEAIFQFNRPGGKKLCQDLKVACFGDLAAVNALDRPGPLQSGGTELYVQRKAGALFENTHPIFEQVTKDTYGILLYQEQVMRICRELAGLSWKDVHTIRKAIAKSQGSEVLEGFWHKFRDGVLQEKTCSAQTARKIWDDIVKHGSYGFNESHAVAYAAISYTCMWLKLYYPAEYLCSFMLYGTNPREAVIESRRRGVSVKEPDINVSREGYSLVNGVIYAGLDAVKGIGESASQEIILKRGDEEFKDFDDFMNRTAGRKVHKGIVRALIEVGAFESLHKNTAALLKHHSKFSGKKKKVGLFDTEEGEEVRANLALEADLPESILIKRIALLPFIPENHPALKYNDVLKKLDNIFPKRTQISELRIAGRANTRNEIRTITGMLTKFQIQMGDMGQRRKVGLAWIEDESGEIVIRLDLSRFPKEADDYTSIGIPIVAVVSPISECRADVREIANLMTFRKGLNENEYVITDSMNSLLSSPGRVVAPLRSRAKHTLKRAVKLKGPHVIGLVTRVWSGNTKIGEMGFVDMADETGQQIVLLWPQSWKTFQGEIEEGKIYEAQLGTTKDQTLCCDVSRGHFFREVIVP